MVQPWWAAQVGWNQNAVGERSSSDSLDETDLALWPGSETKAELVVFEHARFQQMIHEYYGKLEWLSPWVWIRCFVSVSVLVALCIFRAPTSSTQWGTFAASDFCAWFPVSLGSRKKLLGKYLTLICLEHWVQTRRIHRTVSNSSQRKLHISLATICKLLLLHPAILLPRADSAAKETGGAKDRMNSYSPPPTNRELYGEERGNT